jgi:hypothetical protein
MARDGNVSYVTVSNIIDCSCGESDEEVRNDEKTLKNVKYMMG